MMFRSRTAERGTAAVEAALVLGLLLSLALGAFEWGMALRNWTIVTAASREAARLAAAAGDQKDADCLILEAAAGSLRDIGDDQVIAVSIFQSDADGAVNRSSVYRPSVDTDNPRSLRCASWYPVSLNYPESLRHNDGADRDWIGVEVEFDHDWHTGFLWWTGSVCDRGTAPGADCWAQHTIMRIEPAPTPGVPSLPSVPTTTIPPTSSTTAPPTTSTTVPPTTTTTVSPPPTLDPNPTPDDDDFDDRDSSFNDGGDDPFDGDDDTDDAGRDDSDDSDDSDDR